MAAATISPHAITLDVELVSTTHPGMEGSWKGTVILRLPLDQAEKAKAKDKAKAGQQLIS